MDLTVLAFGVSATTALLATIWSRVRSLNAAQALKTRELEYVQYALAHQLKQSARALEESLQDASDRNKALEESLQDASDRNKALEESLQDASDRNKALEESLQDASDRNKALEESLANAKLLCLAMVVAWPASPTNVVDADGKGRETE